MRVLYGMQKEDATLIGGDRSNDWYTGTSTYTMSESRFNFTHLRFQVGYGNDGYTVFEIPVTTNKYFTMTWPTGAGNDCYRIFLFAEWVSDYCFIVRTGKDLWLATANGSTMSNTVIKSVLTESPNSYKCRPIKAIEGLNRKDKKVIPLDLNTWTVVSRNPITIKGGYLTQTGIGDWHENAYKSFTVPESGTYEISYYYKIIKARAGNHATYGYGLWFTQNNPNVDGSAQFNFYTNSANRTGTVIIPKSTTKENVAGFAKYNVTCNAGTTYYLWHPGAALDDGTAYSFDFINIKARKV